jgi:hypothetical protein
LEAIELARRLGVKIAAERQNPQNSLLCSLLAGNLGVETGSIQSASATTQSYATGDFLKECEKPRIGGIRATVRSQRRHRYSRQVVSAHFSLAPKSRFPETETARGRDSVRMPVTPKESEHVVLPRPSAGGLSPEFDR